MAFDLKIANPTRDVQVLSLTRDAAIAILEHDPALSQVEHHGLAELRRRYAGEEQIDFSRIS